MLVERVLLIKDVSAFVMEDLLPVTGLWDVAGRVRSSRRGEGLSYSWKALRNASSWQIRSAEKRKAKQRPCRVLRRGPHSLCDVDVSHKSAPSCFGHLSPQNGTHVCFFTRLDFSFMPCSGKICPVERQRKEEMEQSFELYFSSVGLVVWPFFKTTWRSPLMGCIW